MILCILHVFLLQLHPHLSLVLLLLLKRFAVLLQVFHLLLLVLLQIGLLLDFLHVVFLLLLHLLFIFSRNFRNEHAVISPATVFQQDREHLPYCSYNSILLLSMLQTFSYKLIKAYTLDKQCFVNSVSYVSVDTVRLEIHPVDSVSGKRILVFWFQDNTGDVEMLCIS